VGGENFSPYDSSVFSENMMIQVLNDALPSLSWREVLDERRWPPTLLQTASPVI
jgi:hypothetical protein